MIEAVASRSKPRRLQLLAAMGIDVYVPRPARGSEPASGVAFRLPAGAPEPWGGPHARLFRHLAQACGAEPDDVRIERSPGPPAAIAIDFGSGRDAGAIAAGGPSALAASPAAKRALWDALRRARRG